MTRTMRQVFEECAAQDVDHKFYGRLDMTRPPKSLSRAISERNRHPELGYAIIAEHKLATPAGPAGGFQNHMEIGDRAKAYADGGAVGVSVVTRQYIFRGHLGHLQEAAIATPLPVLRKDFITRGSQIREARAYGADAVLLMLHFLEEDKARTLMRYTLDLKMEPLVEVDCERCVERANELQPQIVGINNQLYDQLGTYDFGITERLAPQIKHGVVVSLSCFSGPEQVRRAIEEYKCKAVLVGTALMQAPPEAKLKELVQAKVEQKVEPRVVV